MAGLAPDAVVVVATVRALKYHGGVAKAELNEENLEALERGLPNLLRHVDNIKNVYGLPCVVAINRFPADTEAELALVEEECEKLGVNVRSPRSGRRAARARSSSPDEVVRLCGRAERLPLLLPEDGLDIARQDRGRGDARSIAPTTWTSPPAAKQPARASCAELGFGDLPVCIAKTQYSFSDDPDKLSARPRASRITVRELKVSAGAGFIVALTGRHHDHARPAQVIRRPRTSTSTKRRDQRPVLSRLSSLRSGSPSPGAWSSALARLRETPLGMGARPNGPVPLRCRHLRGACLRAWVGSGPWRLRACGKRPRRWGPDLTVRCRLLRGADAHGYRADLFPVCDGSPGDRLPVAGGAAAV